MNIVLDTNVLSELLRNQPAAAVLAWFKRQPTQSLYTSAVTQAEMLLGVQLLPAGARRRQLESALLAMFDADFSARIWPFDERAAVHYAQLVGARRAAGRPMAQFDAQIAAIASARGAAVATRNTADFADCGLVLHDPWAPVAVV